MVRNIKSASVSAGIPEEFTYVARGYEMKNSLFTLGKRLQTFFIFPKLLDRINFLKPFREP